MCEIVRKHFCETCPQENSKFVETGGWFFYLNAIFIVI